MNEMTFETCGLRKTKNRQLIYDELLKFDHPVTAEKLFFSFKKKTVDLSTIYRTLNSFSEAGLVKKEFNDKKENVFSICQENDQHVLVCTSCHKRVPLDGCPYHEVNEAIEKKTGFRIQDQNIEIYGLCSECQENNKSKN